MLLCADGLSDLGAITSLADTCGAAVVAQYYLRFHFYERNTFFPFTLLFAIFIPTVQRVSCDCQNCLSLCVSGILTS